MSKERGALPGVYQSPADGPSEPHPPWPWRDLALLSGLVLLVSWLSFAWVGMDQAPPPSDAATHAYHSVMHHRAVSRADGVGEALSHFLLFQEHYPPLVYQASTLLYGCLGVVREVPFLTMIPFLGLLSWSLFGLGWTLGGRPVGWACGIVGSTAPPVLQHSRAYFLDLPLAALTAATCLALLRCRGFSHRGWSLAAASSLSLGLLTKWTLPLYLLVSSAASLAAGLRGARARGLSGLIGSWAICLALGALGSWLFARPEGFVGISLDFWPVEDPHVPLLVWSLACGLGGAAIWGLHRLPGQGEGPGRNLSWCGLIVVSVVSPWYLHNLNLVWHKVAYQAGVRVAAAQVLWLNCRDLATWQVAGPIVLLAGLAVGLSRASTRASVLRLSGDLACGLGWLSLLPQDTRYLLPLLAPLAPLSWLWLTRLGPLAPLPVAFLLGLGLLQAGGHLSARDLGLPRQREARLRSGWDLASLLPVLPPAPDPRSYPYGPLLDALEWAPGSQFTRMDALVRPPDEAALQPRTLLYHAALRGRRLLLFERFGREEPVPDLREPRHYLLFYREGPAGGAPGQASQGRRELMGWLSREGVLVEQDPGPTFRFGEGSIVEVLTPRQGGAAGVR